MSRQHKKKRPKKDVLNSVTTNTWEASPSKSAPAPSTGAPTSAAPSPAAPIGSRWLVLAGMAMLAVFAWSYWPTLSNMVHAWINQPDYSHGFIVLPVALVFLWLRRDRFPRDTMKPSLVGGVLLLAACGLRLVAGLYFLEPLDGWTIPIWLAAAVWLLYGTGCLRWSLASIAFLWFMVPIPYSAERWLSVPLQRIATRLSTDCLLLLGQPAISEGNTIWLGDQQMFVEEACSGMRIFIGIFALAFAYVLFSHWSWWQKAMVLVAAVPVAIVANVTRIVVTGLLYQFASSESAHTFSHDVAGLVMIPFAALLFWLFLIYLEKLFPEVEEVAPIGYR